jgi:hypothetical protein
MRHALTSVGSHDIRVISSVLALPFASLCLQEGGDAGSGSKSYKVMSHGAWRRRRWR